MKARERMTTPEYLRDLAARIMKVPVAHGVDQADAERLEFIAKLYEDQEPNF